MPQTVRAVIVGASGYVGAELVRLLAYHPNVRLVSFVSSSSVGKQVAEVIPAWRRRLPATFAPMSSLSALEADVVFFATPTAVAMNEAKALLDKGMTVIDLGADFRFNRRRGVFAVVWRCA